MAKFALAIHQCKTNSLQRGNIIKVHRTPREDLVKLSQPHNSSSLIAIFSWKKNDKSLIRPLNSKQKPTALEYISLFLMFMYILEEWLSNSILTT